MKHNLEDSKLIENQLVMVQKISEAITTGLSLKQVMDIATECVVSLFNFSNCGVFIIMADKTKLRCESIHMDFGLLNKLEEVATLKIDGLEIPLSKESYFTKVVETGEPVIINDRARAFMDYSDNKKLYDRVRILAKISKDKNVIRVPIIINGIVAGVLGASVYGGVGKLDIKILKLVASQLAMIIFKYRADEVLEIREKHYRRVYDALGEGIVVFKLIYEGSRVVDYIVLDANPAFYKIMNKVPHDIVGRLGSSICKNSMRYLEIMGRTAKYHMVQAIDNVISVRGSQYTISLFNPEDGVVAMSMMNVTAHNRIEKVRFDAQEQKYRNNLYRLREKQLEMYTKALDYAGIPLVMWRLSGIFYVNKKFVSLISCDKTKIIGKSLFDFIDKKDMKRYKLHLEAVASSNPGESKIIKVSVQCFNDTKIEVSISDTRTELGNGDPVFLSAFIDPTYTRRKIRENDLMLEQIGSEIKKLKNGLANL